MSNSWAVNNANHNLLVHIFMSQGGSKSYLDGRMDIEAAMANSCSTNLLDM